MSVVLTAYRPSQPPARAALWRYARNRWKDELGWQIVEGLDNTEPYSRARARNLAAQLAGDWDIALIADADIALRDTAGQVAAAVEQARRTGRLTYPHDHLTMLTEVHTVGVLAGIYKLEDSGEHRHPNTWSQALVVPRKLWDDVGGYDERFVDWGWEDLAFMAACWAARGGVERVRGDAYHLYHSRRREENEGNPNHNANMVLGQRYLAAKTDRRAMQAILAERDLTSSYGGRP